MTAPVDQPFEVAELCAFLVEGGLLEKSSRITLTEYEPAFLRQQNCRRWHYHVRHGQTDVCHLIVGTKLATVHDRAKGIAAACPALICRPLFFRQREDGVGFLCLEHFQGESLDNLVAQGRCDSVHWLHYVRGAQDLLETTRRNSTEEQLVQEVRSLIDQACEYPGLSDFDAQFLRGPAQHAIIVGALSEPSSTRWSNGDFVGRNLLVDARGNFRLIDYEYAEPTHFGSGDWLRLREFSTLPQNFDENTAPEIKAARKPWAEVRMWVHHLTQLKNAHPSEIVTQHVTEAMGRLLSAISRTMSPSSTDKKDSLVIKLIAERQFQTQSLVTERTAWAKSLESELNAARTHFAKLSEEYAERSTWAKSLETELQQTRTHFEKLNQEFNERTTWALSMASELQTMRSSLEEQSQVIANLSKDRDQLKTERLGLGQQNNKLETELSGIKNASAALADLIPMERDKDPVAVLEQSSAILVNLRRDFAVKSAETNHTTALLLETKLGAESAESEALRLLAALKDAQIHIDGLLGHAVQLQRRNNDLEGSKLNAENKIGQKEQELRNSIAKLETVQTELSRYERSLICRLAARAPVTAPHSPPSS